MDIEQLQWKCSCGEARPPTLSAYHSLLASASHRGHKLMLVNKETGEEIARSPKGAGNKGIILPKDSEVLKKDTVMGKESEQKLPSPSESPPPPAIIGEPLTNAGKAEPTALPLTPSSTTGAPPTAIKTAPSEEPKGEGEKEEKEGEHTAELKVASDGIFRIEVTLPADAFTMFNLAKACGLEEDKDKAFDEWLWDCITARFATDYKMRIIIAPMEEE